MILEKAVHPQISQISADFLETGPLKTGITLKVSRV